MIERVTWGGWPNCYRLTDGRSEVIATSDIGPRIVRYGFVGGQNFLLERQEEQGTTGETDFVVRGGHRLWVAPERREGTYKADNLPCDVQVHDDVLVLTGPVEAGTGFRKKLQLSINASGELEVVHRLQNTLHWGVKVSIWALTMMAQGGYGITGFPPRGGHPEHLAPTNPLVMWAFTDLTDPRLTFTKKYLVLRLDPSRSEPFKLGLFNVNTWGAYILHRELFLKRYQAFEAGVYPDFGCSLEIWTNGGTLELETLSPLTQLEPGAWIPHKEVWSLRANVEIKEWNDESIGSIFGS